MQVLSGLREVVDQRLEEFLKVPSNRGGRLAELETPLHEAMRYSCLAPGKRLRPALCIISAESVGGEQSEALDAACAIEMIHCFSLIHDDLPAIDDDNLRRGRPTVHIKFGEAVAILAGDSLHAKGFEILSRIQTDPVKIVLAMQLLTHAIGSDGLVGGETVDVLAEGEPPAEDIVNFIHSRKTGALFAAACGIGAIMGGGSASQVDALFSYGASLGLAFQIADDLLNETATAEQLGKATGSDAHRQKMTFPAAFGHNRSRELALECVEKAKAQVKGLPEHADCLADLAMFAVERIS